MCSILQLKIIQSPSGFQSLWFASAFQHSSYHGLAWNGHCIFERLTLSLVKMRLFGAEDVMGKDLFLKTYV